MANAVTKEQRQKIKDLVLNTVRLMQGKIDDNYKYREAFIDGKSDEELYQRADWCGQEYDHTVTLIEEHWCGQEYDHTVTLIEEPFVDITFDNLQKAADYLGIELEEYVYYYDQSKEGERTATKVPVGLVPIKRMQQLISKTYATINLEKEPLYDRQR